MGTQHQCFSYLNHKLGDFPQAEYIGDNGIHFGTHQFLSQTDLDRIVKTIKNYIDNA
jgi:dTDP-4-amino-4,6-dideoxygalactose transaminase